MQVKILEIRDSATLIPALCVNLNVDPDHIDVDVRTDSPSARIMERRARAGAQHYYMRRMGYPCDGRPNIGITHLNAGGQRFWNDPYGWHDRTWATAHEYIINNWETLKDGDVVDVEFILGERSEPKRSERFDVGT